MSQNTTNSSKRPKLRPIHIHPLPAVVQGQHFLVLDDPLQLANLPPLRLNLTIAPLLHFCDGNHTLPEIRSALMIRAGIPLSLDELGQIIDHLDRSLLLDNEHSQQALIQAREAFRTAPFRPSSMAGHNFPAEPAALKTMLDGLLENLPSTRPASQRPWRGLISPHIDYQRGGPIYAQVWDHAREAVRQAEIVVIWGTDHHGSYGQITLTRQHYATPYGILPTDETVVDAIAAAIGEERAFAEELHHRGEHSVELAAVWLHHMRDGKACRLVPILTGSFYHFVDGSSGDPAEEPVFSQALEALQTALAGKNAIVVAAADLAHIGPAFDGPPVDIVGKAQLQTQDQELMQTICAGDPAAFFQSIQAEGDQRNICGLPPIYLTLRQLGETQGQVIGYDHCPADATNSSFVSICGIVLE